MTMLQRLYHRTLALSADRRAPASECLFDNLSRQGR
jgi:hypothetical protein